jgi:ribosomal protein S18 acetylase RimI-like enzyme
MGLRQASFATIRDYEPRHRDHLRTCVVELQNYEHDLEPALPRGEQMADAYLEFLFERCARWRGKLFVAETDDALVGFVGVLAQVPPESPDESQSQYAYISDLVVLPAHRRKGIGSALLQHAEAFARANGAKSLRIGVLAANIVARELYRGSGFSDYHVQLVKVLSASD